MTLGQMIFITVVVLVILAFILFPNLRTLVKGLMNVFIEDKAKTPEGAEAVFQQAIEEAQEKYNYASDILRRYSGQLSNAQKDLVNKKSKLDNVSKECEILVKNSKFEQAEIKAEERAELQIEIATLTSTVENLIHVVSEAKDINEKCEKNLRQLKADKVNKVNALKLNQSMEKAYNDLDELKNDTTVKKLLSSVEDGVRSSTERAVGAKVVHESKLSTKVERANKTAQSLSTNSYIEELKKKYNK